MLRCTAKTATSDFHTWLPFYLFARVCSKRPQKSVRNPTMARYCWPCPKSGPWFFCLTAPLSALWGGCEPIFMTLLLPAPRPAKAVSSGSDRCLFHSSSGADRRGCVCQGRGSQHRVSRVPLPSAQRTSPVDSALCKEPFTVCDQGCHIKRLRCTSWSSWSRATAPWLSTDPGCVCCSLQSLSWLSRLRVWKLSKRFLS